MNKIFKIKRNALGLSVVTSELAKSRGKTTTTVAALLVSSLLSLSVNAAENDNETLEKYANDNPEAVNIVHQPKNIGNYNTLLGWGIEINANKSSSYGFENKNYGDRTVSGGYQNIVESKNGSVYGSSNLVTGGNIERENYKSKNNVDYSYYDEQFNNQQKEFKHLKDDETSLINKNNELQVEYHEIKNKPYYQYIPFTPYGGARPPVPYIHRFQSISLQEGALGPRETDGNRYYTTGNTLEQYLNSIKNNELKYRIIFENINAITHISPSISQANDWKELLSLNKNKENNFYVFTDYFFDKIQDYQYENLVDYYTSSLRNLVDDGLINTTGSGYNPNGDVNLIPQTTNKLSIWLKPDEQGLIQKEGLNNEYYSKSYLFAGLKTKLTPREFYEKTLEPGDFRSVEGLDTDKKIVLRPFQKNSRLFWS